MIRPIHLTFAASALAFAIACSGSNDPATSDPSGDGDGDSTGDGDGSGDGDGDTTTTGGTVGDGDGDGDGDTTTTGGTVGDGDGDSSGMLGDPPCSLTLTEAGEEIAKGVACTENDPQLCYRSCGPDNVGWKPETCSAGTYAEGDCSFPTGQDYSCYAIPETQHESCPTTVETMPQHGAACDVPACSTCTVDNQYLTSSGDVKVGFCTCKQPNNAGEREWTCSSGTAWPCPLGEGCSN